MEAPIVWTHPLLFTELELSPDFVDVATQCEELAASARESEHLETQHELYERLHACLAQLQPTLLDPIPDDRIAEFTVNVLPDHPPAMETESELLCEYCLALSQLLSGKPLSISIEETLQGLLYELTCFLSDTILAPRWINTPQGLKTLV